MAVGGDGTENGGVENPGSSPMAVDAAGPAEDTAMDAGPAEDTAADAGLTEATTTETNGGPTEATTETDGGPTEATTETDGGPTKDATAEGEQMDAVQSEGGPVATEPADGSGLGGIIAGATPVRHSEAQQQQRRVYPPSDSAQSLIVEHFGFLPIAFIDEIINAANDTVYRATDALCKFVEKEQGGGEATSQAINKAETLLEHAVDKNFDKFELYALRNLFNMPQGLEDYVAMLHRSAGAADEAPVEAADEAALDRALDEVRRELTATRLARTRAQHDTARVERGVRRLRTLNEHLRIDELWRRAPGGGGDVAAAAAAARAQVAEVARLVAQLDADDPERRLSPMDVLKEPSGRDVYLAHMANVQVAAWAAQQAPPMQQPN